MAANFFQVEDGIVTGSIVLDAATGNISTPAAVNATGYFWTGNNEPYGGTYANANVDSFLPTYTGNLTANNIVANGNIVTNGTLIAANYVYPNLSPINPGISLVDGNISANAFVADAVYANSFQYPNGNAYAGTYNDVNVAAFLPINTANIAAGHIVAAGNITAENFYANNGGQYFGYLTGAIGANVANTAVFTDLLAINATITGNLFVNGVFTTVNAQSITLEDPIIFLANSNPANSVDIGFVGTYDANVYTGLLFDHASNSYRLFSNLRTMPTFTADFPNAEPAPLIVGTFTAGDAEVNRIKSQTGFFWANGNAYTGTYSNGTVESWLPLNTANVGANNVIANSGVYSNTGFFWSNNEAYAGTYGNANVAEFLPAYTGNLTADWILANGSVVANANVTANGSLFVGSGVFWSANGEAYSGTYGNANVAEFLPAYTGNLTADWIVANSAITANSWIFAEGNLISNSDVIANGSLFVGAGVFWSNGDPFAGTYSNANVADFLGVNTANVAGNLIFANTGFFWANGNVYEGSYSNANVASYLPSYLGNLTADWIVANSAISANAWIFAEGTIASNSNLAAAGSVFSGNGFFWANGNVYEGSYSNANVASYLTVYTGELTANNLVVANEVIGYLTGAIGANVANAAVFTTVTADEAYLGNLTVNGTLTTINVNSVSVTDSVIVLANGNPSNTLDIGIVGQYEGNLFTGLIFDHTTNAYRLFTDLASEPGFTTDLANTVAASLTVGALTAASLDANGAATVGNLITTDGVFWANGNAYAGTYGNANVESLLVSYTGNLAAGNVTVSSNLTVGDLLVVTNGIVYPNGNAFVPAGSSYGNANVAEYLVSYFGNLAADGITANSNVVIGNSLVLSNLGIFWANGDGYVPAGSSYGNANVADFLPAYTGNLTADWIVANSAISANSWIFAEGTIASNSNIAAAGSVFSANGFFWANGNAYIAESTYSNANVAAYLTAYDGNLTAGNLTLSANGNATIGNTLILGTGGITWANGNAFTAESTYGNTDVAAYLTAYTGNLAAGNIAVTGEVTGYLTGAIGANVANTAVFTDFTANNGVITGNLIVNGNLITVNANNVSLSNSMIFLANGNPFNTVDIGFVGTYDANVFTGLLYDHASNAYRLFNALTEEPGLIANFAAAVSAGLTVGDLVAAATFADSLAVTGLTTAANLVASGTANVGNLITTDGIFWANGNAFASGSTYGNANVAEYLPAYTGNLTAGNVTVNSNVVVGNSLIVTNGVFWANGEAYGYGNTQVDARLTEYAGNLTAGNIVAVNQITGYVNGVIGANVANTATFTDFVANNGVITGNLIVNGNLITINANNVSLSNSMIYLANGNPFNTVDIGFVGTYDSNVFTGLLYDHASNSYRLFNALTEEPLLIANFAASVPATLTVGNLDAAYVNADGFHSTANISADGIANIGNIVTTFGVFWANGEAYGGTYSNANVADYLPVYTGNLAAGNINFSGNLYRNDTLFTGGVTYTAANVAPTSPANGDQWYATDVDILYTRVSDGGTEFWLDISSGASSYGNLQVGNLTITDGITWANGEAFGGTSTYGNANVADYLAAFTGNLTAGNVTVTSNLTIGNSLTITDGIFWANGNAFSAASTYGNTEVGGYLTEYFGNIGAGNLSVNSNVVVGDTLILGTGGITWANGNVFEASGSTYSNANVADYLPTFTGNLTAGNISANSNVTIGNTLILGEGGIVWANGNAFTTGTTYGNSNVAEYLVSYDGNLTAGNLTVNSNVVVGNTLFISSDIFWANGEMYVATGTYGNSNVASYLGGNLLTDMEVGNISLTGNVASTDYATGSLVIIGGVGVDGDINVNGNIYVNGNQLGGVLASFYKGSRNLTYVPANNAPVVFTTTEAAFGSDIGVDYISGIITLAGGKTYRLRGSTGMAVTSGSPAFVRGQWKRLDTNVLIGGSSITSSSSFTDPNGWYQGTAEAIFAPDATTTVQFITTEVVNTAYIGNALMNVVVFQQPWCDIEVIAGNSPLMSNAYTATGFINNDYIQVALTSNLSASWGTTIDFNSVKLTSGAINYNSSGGTFTLLAGKTYSLRASVMATNFNTNPGWVKYQWVDGSGSPLSSVFGIAYSAESSLPTSGSPGLEVIYKPSTTSEVALRIVDVAPMGGFDLVAGGTYATIEQIDQAFNISNISTLTSTATIYANNISIDGNITYRGTPVTSGKIYQNFSMLGVLGPNDVYANSNIEFNTVISSYGNITTDNSGIITLEANKTYDLTAVATFYNFTDGTNGQLTYEWVNADTLVPLDSTGTGRGTAMPNNHTSNVGAYGSTATTVYATTEVINVVVRITSAIGSATVSRVRGTYAKVVELNQDFMLTNQLYLSGNLNVGNNLIIGNSIYYANGNAFIAGSTYANSNVAAYLPIYTGNLTAGNLSVNSNVVVGNTLILGNGGIQWGNGNAFTSGSTYSNSNVASYLVSYYGNIAAGNLTANGNVTIGSNLTVIGNVIANANVNVTGNLTVVGNIVGGGVRTTSSATPPANPTVGDLWYATGTDGIYRFTTDGTTSVWLDISGPSGFSSTTLNYISNGTSNVSIAGVNGNTTVYHAGKLVSTFSTVGVIAPVHATPVAVITDVATNGLIGTAALTVDASSMVLIAQSTANRILTLPTPTVASAARTISVVNTGNAAFTMHGIQVMANSGVQMSWTGSTWASYQEGGSFGSTTILYPDEQDSTWGWGWCFAVGNRIVRSGSADYARPHGLYHNTQSGQPSDIPIINPPDYFTKLVQTPNNIFALGNNGKIYAFGYNQQGTLGIGSTTERYGPMTQIALNGVVDFWVPRMYIGGWENNGAAYGSVIAKTGSPGAYYYWGWGRNSYGQLGLGNTTSPITSPTQITGLNFLNITKISMGSADGTSTLALTDTGLVYVAGYNGDGQLSIGNATSQTTFTLCKLGASTTMSGVTDIYSGYFNDGSNSLYNTYFIINGAVYGCGNYIWYMRGDGQAASFNSYYATQMKTGASTYLANAVKIYGGTGWGAVIKDSSNNLWGWGYNRQGYLGTGDAENGLVQYAKIVTTNVNKVILTNRRAEGSMYVFKNDGTVWYSGAHGGANNPGGIVGDNGSASVLTAQQLLIPGGETLRTVVPIAVYSGGWYLAHLFITDKDNIYMSGYLQTTLTGFPGTATAIAPTWMLRIEWK